MNEANRSVQEMKEKHSKELEILGGNARRNLGNEKLNIKFSKLNEKIAQRLDQGEGRMLGLKTRLKN
jgi:hypothetical protein